jgi:hypothetical protein
MLQGRFANLPYDRVTSVNKIILPSCKKYF